MYAEMTFWSNKIDTRQIYQTILADSRDLAAKISVRVEGNLLSYLILDVTD